MAREELATTAIVHQYQSLGGNTAFFFCPVDYSSLGIMGISIWRKALAMATYEESGGRWGESRWIVRRADGSLLLNDKGNTKYFRLESNAKSAAEDLTEQENNPGALSWQTVMREAAAWERSHPD